VKVRISTDWRKTVKLTAAFVALGFGLTLLGSVFPEHLELTNSLRLLLVILPATAMAAQFVALALHEFGHLVASILFGFKVIYIGFGGLQFILSGEDKWELLPESGAVASESTLLQDRPWPNSVVSFAGPFVDILVGSIAAFFAFKIESSYGLLLLLLTISSARNAYISLSPSYPGLLSNDIKQILDVWKPQSQIFAHRSFRRIYPILAGEDPRSFESEDVRRALWLDRDLKSSIVVTQIATYYSIANDAKEAVEMGARYVTTCRELLATDTDDDREQWESLLQDALLESAFAAALVNDLSCAHAFEAELVQIDSTNWHTARRMHSALLLASGRTEDACRAVKTAQSFLDQDKASTPSPMWNTAELFLDLVRVAATKST